MNLFRRAMQIDQPFDGTRTHQAAQELTILFALSAIGISPDGGHESTGYGIKLVIQWIRAWFATPPTIAQGINPGALICGRDLPSPWLSQPRLGISFGVITTMEGANA